MQFEKGTAAYELAALVERGDWARVLPAADALAAAAAASTFSRGARCEALLRLGRADEAVAALEAECGYGGGVPPPYGAPPPGMPPPYGVPRPYDSSRMQALLRDAWKVQMAEAARARAAAPAVAAPARAASPSAFFAAAEAPPDGFEGLVLPLAALRGAAAAAASATPGYDAKIREAYLSAAEFESTFGMTKAAFFKLPKWKRGELKKKAELF